MSTLQFIDTLLQRIGFVVNMRVNKKSAALEKQVARKVELNERLFFANVPINGLNPASYRNERIMFLDYHHSSIFATLQLIGFD